MIQGQKISNLGLFKTHYFPQCHQKNPVNASAISISYALTRGKIFLLEGGINWSRYYSTQRVERKDKNDRKLYE